MHKAMYDTSILIEPFRGQKDRNYGQAALLALNGIHSLDRQYTPVVSMSVLGELKAILNKKEGVKKDTQEKIFEINQIHENFFDRCEIVGITKETISLCRDILTEDDRLDPLDVLHFSCAVCSGCKTFIFIDKKIKDSKIIRRIAKEKDFHLTPFDIPANLDK